MGWVGVVLSKGKDFKEKYQRMKEGLKFLKRSVGLSSISLANFWLRHIIEARYN